MINVKYKVLATPYSISKFLDSIEDREVITYDCETQSLYSQDEIKEAKDLLKDPDKLDHSTYVFLNQVANSDGLSNPRIVKVTHFIFGLSRDEAVVCIAYTPRTEKMIMRWLVNFKNKIVIHNATFDLKLVYNRTNKIPPNIEDTQLLAKTFINDASDFRAKTGLKELMRGYYDHRWELIETYNVVNYKDPNFIRYCAIDGAATFYLWEQLQEVINEQESD